MDTIEIISNNETAGKGKARVLSPERLYIWGVACVFAVFTVVFLTFPRSRYSELEKRELASFPELTWESLRNNEFTQGFSSWFSDTEPFREELMGLSMKVNSLKRWSLGADEDAVTFHASEDGGAESGDGSFDGFGDGGAKDNPLANANAKISHSGILVVGKAPNARALMAFGGSANGGQAFAAAVSKYKATFPGVNVYAMVIPLASEFYLPEKAKSASKPQRPFIEHCYSLMKGVKGVDAAGVLAAHIDEDIYLRTDHHWGPLGAYYAAGALAQAAGVPFRKLDAYDRKTIHRFVGSMYGYSKDITVKESPEDFVYHVPNQVSYSTTYRTYTINEDYAVTGESREVAGPYFYSFKDGSGMAYSTFMGSDNRLTKVKTGTKNGRRLLIIKDSYGNAVPGYLFYSFEEVHVVDFRYFTRNMQKYVKDNGITDIAFVVNVFNAYAGNAPGNVTRFLTQGDGVIAPVSRKENAQETPKEKGETTPAGEGDEKKQETPKEEAQPAEPIPSGTGEIEE